MPSSMTEFTELNVDGVVLCLFELSVSVGITEVAVLS